MCLDFFSEETLCGSIPVNDHSVFAFWVVAYRRFDCMQECRPEFSAPRAAAVHTVPDNVQPPLPPPDKEKTERGRERTFVGRGCGYTQATKTYSV